MSHVGTDRTFGPAEEADRQQSPGQSGSADWQERHREYPEESEGREQYGHGHRHGDEAGDWPLGEQVTDDSE